MNLTIDRTKWLRGEPSGDSFLLRKRDGKMCCLGILGCEIGYSLESLLGIHAPDDVEDKKLFYKQGLLTRSNVITKVCDELMEANDSEYYVDEIIREDKIASLMKKIDVEVSFVN